MSAVIATIAPKANDELSRVLVDLFSNYDTPFGSNAETRRAKARAFLWACEGRPIELVERTVKAFLTGKVKRSRSAMSKLPTSEEFAAEMDVQAAKGREVQGSEGARIAPPFGPLWAVRLFSLLLAGPDANMPRPPVFIRKKIAAGGAEGERYRLAHQAANGFGQVAAMLASAENARGCVVDPRLQALAGEMEPVPVGSTVFNAWRDEFQRRGWPWLPSAGKQRVAYFPKGGPGGLDAVAAAFLRAVGGGQELSSGAPDRRG